MHLHIKPLAWTFALFNVISYLLCVVWGLVTPEAVHMHEFLEAVLPAFEWITPLGFLLGLVESFLWGVYFAVVLVPLFNWAQRRWGCGTEGEPAH